MKVITTTQKKVQLSVLATVLGLGLALGVASAAQAQPNNSALGHSGTLSLFAGKHHQRPSQPVHRGHGRHHSGPAIQRHSRPGHMSPQARTADWYARTAVSQSHTAWRVGCANSHPRWSTSYQEHFRWAYGRSAHQMQREIERRDHSLGRCLAH